MKNPIEYDNNKKIFVVDETKRLTGVDEFTVARQHFEMFGSYTNLYPGSAKWLEFWKEEKRRCIEGYNIGRDAITGYHYFYLNYSPIIKVKYEGDIESGTGQLQGSRIEGFPDFWDSDYDYFWYLEEAERAGQHGVVLKTRGRGYSFKGGSMLCRNFFLIPRSKSYAVASEMEFLTKDGLLSKAWENMAFVNDHTAWYKAREKKDTDIHKRASYIDSSSGRVVEKGYLSEIIGISLKDRPNKIRGKRGKLVLFEEGGQFPGLLQSWQITQPGMQAGRVTFGLMVAYGCVCAGTKVWDNTGNLVNIEDLYPENGIVGYADGYATLEPITHCNPPATKPCYRITTNTGRYLECSEDHPILWSTQHLQKRYGPRKENKTHKRAVYKEAKDIKVGDQLAIIDSVPVFNVLRLWEPRLLGWLVGDGSYGFNKTPILSNCDYEINSYVESKFDTVTEKQYTTKLGKIYKKTRIKGITKNLRAVGIYGQTKDKKTLPKDIHLCVEEDIVEFLGGLFDAHGSIRLDATSFRIILTSAYFSLLDEVRFLLQKLGIHCNINRIKKSTKPGTKDRNDYFRLEIGDVRSTMKFAEKIKFFVKEKQKKLECGYILASSKDPLASKHLKGIRFEKVVNVEFIGEKRIFNLTAGNNHTYIANGIITHNTGGSEDADYAGLEELFYKPRGYNILQCKNIWDVGMEDTTCGFFVPEYRNAEGFMDSNGNSLIDLAKQNDIEQRENIKLNSKDPDALIRYIAERPHCPADATLRLSGSIFPQGELSAWETKLSTNTQLKLLTEASAGRLYYADGKIKFKPDLDLKPITEFPIKKGTDKTGAVVVYQTPYKVDDAVPDNLYFICCDPYGIQTDGGESLGACYVIKRVNPFSRPDDMIVASYVGRPEFMDDFNRNVFMLAEYYNAKIAFENDRGDIIPYARSHRKLHWLIEEPELYDNSGNKFRKLGRGYGISMGSIERKKTAAIYLRDWLLTERSQTENGEKILNLHYIYDLGLVRELRKFSFDGNFDRTSALLVGMFYRQDLMTKEILRENNSDKDDFFNRELFI